MSKNLIEEEGFILTEFWGGNKRGTCYQINVFNYKKNVWEYVQVTDEQFTKIMRQVK